MRADKEPSPSNSKWIGLALFLFLSAVYLLAFTGSYYSIDEMAMFNMAESFLKERVFSVDQLNWIEMSGVPIGAYGRNGRLYCKLAQTQSLAALPLVWLARQSASLGTIQTAFLTNVFLTATNGLLLYRLGRRLGYDERASLLAALIYGLATIALPYAKTFFSEPLAGTCLIGAMYLLAVFVRERGLWRPAAAGCLLGIAAMTRLMNLALIPLYGAYLLLAAPLALPAPERHTSRRARFALLWRRLLTLWQPLAALLLPTLVAVGLIGWYNLSRYGNALEAGYAPWERFTGNVLTGLYTLLLSPGKSLFLYTPVYLLVLLLLPRFCRRRQAEGTLVIAVTFTYLAVIARWWAPYAGWCWGPRYLVPLAPLWALPLLELRDTVARSRRWQTAAAALTIISLGVQLLGTVVDYAEWLRSLGPDQTPMESLVTVFDPRFAAHRGHWLMLQQGQLDLGWFERPDLQPVTGVDWPVLWPLLGLLALTGAGLIVAVCGGGRRRTGGLILLGLIVLPAIAWGTLRHYGTHRLISRDDTLTLIDVLETHDQPGDAILSAAVTHSQTFQNLYKGALPIYGVRNDPLPHPPEVTAHLAEFIERHKRLWLLLEWTRPRDPESGLETWLAERAFRATEWEFGGLRLVLYGLGVLPPVTDQHWRLGDQIDLQGYALSPTVVSRGDIVRLALIWSAHQPIGQDYTVFIHVLDEAGRLVAQLDRRPWGGLRPTSGWSVGERIADRYGLAVNEKLPPGKYHLAVGLYTWPNLERLWITDASGKSVGDHLLLPGFEVIP